jgi:hypothetical protein
LDPFDQYPLVNIELNHDNIDPLILQQSINLEIVNLTLGSDYQVFYQWISKKNL